MDKKLYLVMGAIVVILGLLALPNLTDNPLLGAADDTTLEGRYVGYSWSGEADGVELEEASSYIETVIELDSEGIITDARMRFFVQKDGFWIPRQSGNSYVEVDFDVDPTRAVPGEDYSPGDSMFTVYNADMMAFYAAVVNEAGETAVALVCPSTRYQFEIKLPDDFDYDTPFGELTIESGKLVPTILTSGSGILRPENWDELEDSNFLNISNYNYVVTQRGAFEGLNEESSTREFMEAMGVEFSGGQPQPMEVEYGYFGMGGWDGNYRSIEEYLVGQDAREVTSLVDWSIERYAGGVNEENQFGVDVESGATRTVQDGVDTISGATVRMSRESASYQRALVEAGILREQEVIVGRF